MEIDWQCRDRYYYLKSYRDVRLCDFRWRGDAVQNNEIQRLQDDLSTMRQAIRLDKAYDKGDIAATLLLGLGALIAMPIFEFTSWNRRLVLAVALTPGLLAFSLRYATTRRIRAERPQLWNEYKLSVISAICVIPTAVGWMWWSEQFGTARQAAGSAIVFCIGVVLAGVGVLDSNRRTYLFGGVPMIAFGLAIPWLTPHRIGTVGLGVIVFALLSTAAFIWWQTRFQAASQDGSESLT